MNQKPVILVIGATGAQGGSVAYALLHHHKFSIRFITRNPDSANATALKKARAEVFQGDLEDPETLKQALRGCYGVFGITHNREDAAEEYRHGKNLIDAVQQIGIQHFVLSAAPSYHALSQGVFPVPQYDIKAALQAYAKSLELPATFVHPSFYYENFLHDYPLQKSTEVQYEFGSPQGDTKFAMASVADLGEVVATIFDHPVEYIGRVVGVVGENRTCAAYAAIMTKILGLEVGYHYIPRDDYARLDFPNAESVANMFEVQRRYFPDQQIQLIESYGLNPAMQSFEKWLSKNRDQFLVAAEGALQLEEGLWG